LVERAHSKKEFMTFDQQPVLITGASQGIGRSIAIAFASETSRPLILMARNFENLSETKKLCEAEGNQRIELIACDAADANAVESIELPADLPEPSLLINNAGSYLYKPLETTTEEEFRHQIDVNLFTAVNVTSRFLPSLKERERGLIINISSVGATRGLAESGAYSAAKHALLGYTRSLRKELLGTNVGVTALNLGQTHSPSWSGSSVSPIDLIDPKDVAALIIAISGLSPRSVVEELLLQPQHGKVPPM
jgi:short-subunit dehydrogenase